jgi:superfamily II DNA/RNA helicase
MSIKFDSLNNYTHACDTHTTLHTLHPTHTTHTTPYTHYTLHTLHPTHYTLHTPYTHPTDNMATNSTTFTQEQARELMETVQQLVLGQAELNSKLDHLLKATVHVPKATVPVPKATVPAPKATVPVPKAAVPAPKATVPVPKAVVPTPKAAAATMTSGTDGWGSDSDDDTLIPARSIRLSTEQKKEQETRRKLVAAEAEAKRKELARVKCAAGRAKADARHANKEAERKMVLEAATEAAHERRATKEKNIRRAPRRAPRRAATSGWLKKPVIKAAPVAEVDNDGASSDEEEMNVFRAMTRAAALRNEAAEAKAKAEKEAAKRAARGKAKQDAIKAQVAKDAADAKAAKEAAEAKAAKDAAEAKRKATTSQPWRRTARAPRSEQRSSGSQTWTRARDPHTEQRSSGSQTWTRARGPRTEQRSSGRQSWSSSAPRRTEHREHRNVGRKVEEPARCSTGSTVPAAVAAFNDMDLSKGLLLKIASTGFDAPTAVQQHMIVPMCKGRDVLAQAPVGSGKTLAYSAGLLSNVRADRGVQAVVVVPAGKLRAQVAKVLTQLAPTGVKVAELNGNMGELARMIRSDRTCPDVIVGCPGTVSGLMSKNRGYDAAIDASQLRVLVLDEADALVDPQHMDKIVTIMNKLPASCARAMFSATLPDKAKALMAEFLTNPVTMMGGSFSNQSHFVLDVAAYNEDALMTVLDTLKRGDSEKIVFVRAKKMVNAVRTFLEDQGISATTEPEELGHGASVLVATDGMARGFDVPTLSTVVNLGLPRDSDFYVHRAGRCGRHTRRGIVINLMTARDADRLVKIAETYEVTLKAFTAVSAKKALLG